MKLLRTYVLSGLILLAAGRNGAVAVADAPPEVSGRDDHVDGRPSQTLPLPDGVSAWGIVPWFTAASGVALLVLAAANALSRSGRVGGQALFWIAMLGLVAIAAFRLASPAPARRERIGIVAIIAVTLYVEKVIRDPFTFLISDEFIHAYNAQRILDTGHLFGSNPLLPVATDYPGLPATTSAVASLTGLDVFGAGLLVIGAARLLLTVSLFLLFEEISRSPRIAGLAALLYAAHPNYLFFTAQHAYESLALPIAVFVMASVAKWMRPEDRVARRGWAVAASIATIAVAMTHHLTTYALLAFLVAASLAHLLVARGRGTANPWPFALVCAGATIGWLTFVASATVGYLTFIFTRAVKAAVQTALNERETRQLFESDSSAATPPVEQLEQLVALASVVVIAIAMPIAVREIWSRYRSPVALVFAAAGLGYLAMLSLRLVPRAWEVGNRASEFLFLGVAFALALVAVRGADLFRPFLARAVVTGVVVIVFAGGVIAGWPRDLRLGLPYRVVAGSRVLEPQGAAAARWSRSRLGAGRRFAADESNARLLMARGQFAFAGRTFSLDEMLEEERLAPWMVDVLRDLRVRYVAVDRRRIRTDRLAAYFFSSPRAAGAGLFHRASYEKFIRQPGVSKIFDGGDIAIYDLRGLRYDPDFP